MFGVGHRDEDDWQLKGECYVRREEVYSLAKTLGYDIFYPDNGKTEEAYKLSKKFCGPCPVKLECLTEALDNFEHGTWGNETFRTRKTLASLRRTDLLTPRMQRLGLLLDENTDHSEVSSPDPAA